MEWTRTFIALTVTVALLAPSTGRGQERSGSDATPAQAWYERIDFGGDLRLRYEGFYLHETPDGDWRHRLRARIRAGFETQVTSWMKVGLEVRSGDPRDPVSDNETYEGAFSMKPIAIAAGYAALDVTPWLDVSVGKFSPNRLWTVSDLQWDDDVTVEGALERLKLGAFEASLYQYSLAERSRDTDAALLGGQARVTRPLASHHAWSLGGGFDAWIRPQLVVDLTQDDELRGNAVTHLLDDEGQLVSEFTIVNAFATWRYTGHESWPVRAMFYGYTNTGAGGAGADHDLAAFARLQFGDFKRAGAVMARYSFYYSEPDALFYVFMQSDTNRSSDVRGHRVDVRVGSVAGSYANLTWYHTDAVHADSATLDRWQVDYIIVF